MAVRGVVANSQRCAEIRHECYEIVGRLLSNPDLSGGARVRVVWACLARIVRRLALSAQLDADEVAGNLRLGDLPAPAEEVDDEPG